jgi:hypothetical protein
MQMSSAGFPYPRSTLLIRFTHAFFRLFLLSLYPTLHFCTTELKVAVAVFAYYDPLHNLIFTLPPLFAKTKDQHLSLQCHHGTMQSISPTLSLFV